MRNIERKQGSHVHQVYQTGYLTSGDVRIYNIMEQIMLKPDTQAEMSLADQAYIHLRQEIITCRLPPESEVSEHDLAKRLGMSKTPVHEALARLAMEGFVDIVPRRGSRIKPVTIKDINDLFVVRLALESTAASLAAIHITDNQLNELDRLAKASYTKQEEASIDYFIEANKKFHIAVARASGNPRLATLITALLEESARFFYIGARLRDVSDLNMETNQEHNQIVKILRKHNSAAAHEVILKHTESTRAGLIHAIMNSGNMSVSL
ncbi:GntR family transcriptional regulator [Acetobacter sp. P5B1]|uniref:GntR family transcriptional regulator n=1 Tax=Acetobacter sp. P5B1 TaxID=2762620 RepID=UPI00207B11F3|nr:GntR family transcriptional regulator [Acetobacter sp. P5B1]